MTRLFSTALSKKRVAGIVLLAIIVGLFFALNRFPKLDAVGGDLDAVGSATEQCFQGFCIERDAGTGLLEHWWRFSVTYLRLVAIGMGFAFLVAGLAEAFLFPSEVAGACVRGGIQENCKGYGRGPSNEPVFGVYRTGLDSLWPEGSRDRRDHRDGAEFRHHEYTGPGDGVLCVHADAGIQPASPGHNWGVIAGSDSRAWQTQGQRGAGMEVEPVVLRDEPETGPWVPVLMEACRDWVKASVGYLVRLGPLMVVAAFVSGLVIQWLSPGAVSTYLGNNIAGIAIAATFGILINVPLLFEIPLVALLLLFGMGTAPAATLTVHGRSGWTLYFWGLAKAMPKRAIATFAAATWILGALGGLAVLGIGVFIWESGDNLRVEAANKNTAPVVMGEPFSSPITAVTPFTRLDPRATKGPSYIWGHRPGGSDF